jgi:hypothetical protein
MWVASPKASHRLQPGRALALILANFLDSDVDVLQLDGEHLDEGGEFSAAGAPRVYAQQSTP